MVYDFVSKIKNAQDAVTNDDLSAIAAELTKDVNTPLELKFVMSGEKTPEFLVKSQVSISSMTHLHDKELEDTIEAFIKYLEGIAEAIKGEVSRQDGFYNSTRTFKRLFT
ncbi:MAG: hypothetical protein FWG65_11300 [Turicibacter sp.]|nr:hypothetical protein [Turicibacter sp.]